jgi:uncharacterized membrane protein HdeD (DUF308 family)
MPRFQDRSTGDILILSITFTVCVSVMASGIVIALVSLLHPDKDVSVWISRITGIINTMIGVMAGFLAGRTDVATKHGSSERVEPSDQ